MGNFTLTPELKEKIIAKAIDKGSAFLTGSPTTVFTTVSNVAETTGQVMGSAAAVPFKAMNTAADLMELVPAVSTIMIADISAYLGMRLGEAVGEMAALPTPADILGKSQKKVAEKVKSAQQILMELSQDSEKNSEEEAENAKQAKFKKFQNNVAKTIGKVNKVMDKIGGDVQNWAAEICSYMNEGPIWVTEKANLYEDIAFAYIGKFIDDKKKIVLDAKAQIVDDLSESLANKTAKAIDKAAERHAKKRLDKVTQTNKQAENKAKAKIGKALLKLYAQLGL